MKIQPVIRDFLTGAVALFGLVGTILVLILFGEFADTGRKYYFFTLHVPSAGGLSDTSAVTLNGVRVGQVARTGVLPSPANGAEIQVKIYDDIKIPKAVTVSIDKGFVGDASLEFRVPATATAASLSEVIPPDSVFEASDASSTLERLASSIQKPLQRFGQTAEKIEKLAETYTAVGERVNELLEPRTLADVQAGKEPNIRSTIARADVALARATAVISDEQLVGEAKRVLARANTVMDDVSGLAKTWTNTAANLDKNVSAITVDAAGMMQSTQKAATELATAIETINRGQGTMGQLLQNPDLYNSLRDAAQRLDRALNEVQLLVEKYKTEGLPLKFGQ
jgi:phospholipid/cholesterol/gamma-HCH transport system substrate-binding protein